MPLAGMKVRRQWRGRDRGLLRLLQRAILSMNRRDVRVGQYADAHGLDGFFFGEPDAVGIQAALQLLSDRVDECLEAKH